MPVSRKPAKKPVRRPVAKPRALRAKDVMQTRVVTVSRDAPLSEAERLLADHRISGMPVTDASGRAIGVVSYRDLLDRWAEDPDARPRRVRGFYRLPTEDLTDEELLTTQVPEESEDVVEDVMTPEVIRVTSGAGLRDVCRTMARHDVHRVLVTDPRTHRVVGIVSSMDVLKALAR